MGKYKVDVAKDRVLDINPGCTVRTYRTFYMPDTRDQFDFSEYDYVIDAIDTVTAKIDLVVTATANGTPVISSMGAGNKLDPTAFTVADIYNTSVCPLAKVMRYELRRRGIKSLKVVYSKEPPTPPAVDPAAGCRENCICPPGTARTCTAKAQYSGVGFLRPLGRRTHNCREVIKDILKK